MSRKARTALYAVCAFAILIGMVFLMAWQQGIDPLHPRTRNYWLAAALAALYISIRGSVFLERVQYSRERKAESDGDPQAGRLSNNIKDRMAARHARVAAAREKAEKRQD